MGRKLNGWQRLGIVLSVLWLCALSAATALYYSQATPFDELAVVRWFDPETQDYVDDKWSDRRNTACGEKCSSRKTQIESQLCSLDCNDAARLRLEKRFNWLGFTIIAAVSVLAAWFLAYAIVWVSRWVVRGFRRT